MEEKSPGLARRLFGGLMKFISALRLLVVNLFFLVIIAVVIFALSGSELPKIPEQGALVLNLEGRLVDQQKYVDPFVRLMGQADPQQREILVQDVIDAVQHAKEDDRITLLVLSLDNFVYGGISKIQEIAAALEDFRSSGKKIIAAGDSYTQDQYLLAAQADEVYIHPMGGVLLQGYGLYRSYFKQALDKLEINFHVFRVGDYKSAMEPFVRDDMSDYAREANLVWLNSLWNDYTADIAERRKSTPEAINQYINGIDTLLAEYNGNTASVAAASGLIDGVKNRDEMNQYLVDMVGVEDEEGYYRSIGFERYLWLKNIESPAPKAESTVGVIVAAGNIIDGEQPPGSIGGDTLAELIYQARRDASVRSVVLRVDSGGGSAFASEVIRRELEMLQAEGKPLVVSMGSMAASGGYWISALADEIWATPTTLTGSIGIFGAFPTIEKTLGNLGVNSDGVGTTQLAGTMRLDRPLAPIAERAIQSTLEYGYYRFLEIVAQGRDMSKEQVEALAQGRVWSGTDAQRLGLVDKLGGLEQAVASAAALADLEQYDTRLIELPLSPREQLLRELMGGEVAAKLFGFSGQRTVISQLQRWLAPFTDSLTFLQTMNDPRGLYLHCTACVAP